MRRALVAPKQLRNHEVRVVVTADAPVGGVLDNCSTFVPLPSVDTRLCPGLRLDRDGREYNYQLYFEVFGPPQRHYTSSDVIPERESYYVDSCVQ